MNNNTKLRVKDLTIIKRRERHLPSFFKRKDGHQFGIGYLVKGMNLSIHKNRIHGIVGESGSGKSLTMKAILGLIDFSPGIVQGEISYFSDDGMIQVLPEDAFLRDIPQPLKEKLSKLRRKTKFLSTEYITFTDDEWVLQLKKKPESDFIKVYSIDLSSWQCRELKFEPPTQLTPRLIKLEDPVSHEEIVTVSYHYSSSYSSSRLKKKIDRIQKVKGIRGEKVAMILQDPQTFLNPYWNIEKQIRNLIGRKKRETGKLLSAEKNFTIRIFGGDEDFPVKMSYDKESMKRYLHQAELWVNGVRNNLLDADRLPLIEGSSYFWGIKTVGKRFQLEIAPLDDFPIFISWDPSVLRSHVQEAAFSTGSKNGSLLSMQRIKLTADDVSSDGVIRVDIELFAGSGEDFSFPIAVHYTNTQTELTIGWEKGATEHLDPHKGEMPIKVKENEFYAGFVIEKTEKGEKLLSQSDIRAPVDIMIAEATLTITPKYDQNYIGELLFEAAGDRKSKRTLSFGLISGASEGVDEAMGEIHMEQRIKEGYFDVGFIIDNGESGEVYSPKDFRGTRILENPEREVLRLLSKVDLNDREGRFRQQFPKGIAGGQAQRVMISLAMTSKPELLIADEPTTGLDVTKQTEIVHLFQQYKEQGRTILLISHDLNFVRHLADEFTIVYAGCDLEHLTYTHLLTQDKLHPYTKRLLSIVKSKGGREFESIPGDVPDPYRIDFTGCPFAPRCCDKAKIATDGVSHVCKDIYPPLINVETGKVDYLESWEKGECEHLIRCWIYLKGNENG